MHGQPVDKAGLLVSETPKQLVCACRLYSVEHASSISTSRGTALHLKEIELTARCRTLALLAVYNCTVKPAQRRNSVTPES